MTRGGTNRRRTCIDTLDDDSILNIFYHCRPPVVLDETDGDGIGLWGGRWECEYWWYKPARVCRRWRRLILASPSYLGVNLVCRYGTPVADMLAHAPPLPLIIDHIPVFEEDPTEMEEKILLVLKHRDRVRRIRLRVSDPQPTRIIETIDNVYPLLEYLHIQPLTPLATNLSLSSTLRAPHLRHLVLHNFVFPSGSPLLVGLVTLSLECTPSANFGPKELLQQLPIMPHLETLRTSFYPPLSNQDVERQLSQIAPSTHVTLPTLRWFGFEGPSAYMEAVLPRTNMPLLKVTEIVSTTHESDLLNLTTSILFTQQSLWETKHPRLCDVRVTFYNMHMVITMRPQKRTGIPTLHLRLLCLHPATGLRFTVQIFDGVREMFTEVESLSLEDKTSFESLEEFAIRAGSRWRKLLGSFNQVRTLHVFGGDLVEALSRSLLPHDGESAIELLPMLRVLSCPHGTHVSESCRSFLAARQNAGFPVTISHQ